MRKNLPLIIFIFAVVLNVTVLGLLATEPSTQNNDTANVADLTPKVLVSTIPSAPLLAPNSTSNISLSPSSDKLTITSVQVNESAGTLLVSVYNIGSTEVAITNVNVNNYAVTLEKSIVITANSNINLLLTLADGITFANTYQIKLQSSEGYSATFYKIID